MSIKTSNIDFRPRLAHEMNDTIMRNAVVMAQERIGANRQIMVKELGDWE
ncbi:amino acid dehydrogenase, partial [Klebsiella oxytoca]